MLVLWLLVLLSVMAVSFSGTTRTQARIARNLYENVQARWMADAGVRLAVRTLWLAEPDRIPSADAGPRFCEFQSGSLAISVQNVSGLIDLNAASIATLEKLFAAAGAGAEARHLAEAVADFRDRNDNPEPNGAESQAYEAAGLAHGPKNAAFQAIEELEQVLDLPPELFTRVRPALTVHSQRPAPDLRVAPPLVRSVYGTGRRTAGSATRGATRTASPQTFAIIVTARTPSGTRFVRQAVISVQPPPSPSYRILHWNQAAGSADTSFPDKRDLPPC